MIRPERPENTVLLSIEAMEADGTSMFEAITSGAASEKLTPYVQAQVNQPAEPTAQPSETHTEDSAVSREELHALDEQIALIEHLRDTQDTEAYPTDATFLEQAIQSVKRGAVSLPLMATDVAISAIRKEISHGIFDAWMSAAYTKLPRFYTDSNGNVVADDTSRRWTPSYFKIAKAQPALAGLLRGRDIIDPYAGTGTTAYTLLAKGLAGHAMLSDLSYIGGQPLEGEKFYDPNLNRQMIESLFRGLPNAYKPSLGARSKVKVADARDLPYDNNTADFVVTDPPYGVDCPHGDKGTLLESLPELLRVSRFGAVLLAPVIWQQQLEDEGYRVTPLTKSLDPARVEVAFVHISKT